MRSGAESLNVLEPTNMPRPGGIFGGILGTLSDWLTRTSAHLSRPALAPHIDSQKAGNSAPVAHPHATDDNLRHLDNYREAVARESQLRAQCLRYAAALQNLPHGLTWFDRSQKLVMSNGRFNHMYGLGEALTVPGTRIEDIINPDLFPREMVDGFRLAMAKGVAWSGHFEFSDGRHIAVSHMPMPDGGSLGTHTDVTAHRQLEDRIFYLAHHDALTDLANRHGLRIVASDAVARMERGERFSILCLDLDHFKQINDTLGHPIGDQLLRVVSQRLRNCVRKTDTVARIGGDEFAIVQVQAEQPCGAAELARRLIKELSAPYNIDGHQIVIGTSIGIVLAPGDGQDIDTLLKNADLALYRAKSDGRGRFHFYEPEMDARVQERRLLELDLRQAVELEQLELHYQPILDIDSETIRGFEALLRWRHPTRGLLAPAAFIELAEEIGLMRSIGSWVVKTACKEAATWEGNLRVAVNVSATQFSGHPVELDVIAALETSGLAPSRLELEITETVLLEDTAATLATLSRLRDLGVRIALDDFGIGYSSLSYLRSFPFDKVKIDRSFVHAAEHASDNSQAIVKAVIDLSNDLGMATTAEGVERLEQLEFLRQRGCKEVQGYMFSRPVPASEVPGLLRGEQRVSGLAR